MYLYCAESVEKFLLVLLQVTQVRLQLLHFVPEFLEDVAYMVLVSLGQLLQQAPLILTVGVGCQDAAEDPRVDIQCGIH